MKERPTEFKTRKGQRVYRRRIYRKNSEPSYASHYTLRVRQDKNDCYFNLGVDKRKAGIAADEVISFLGLPDSTVEEALVRYSATHHAKSQRETKRSEGKVPVLRSQQITVGMVCERYEEVTNHYSPTTVKANLNALRHIAAGVLKLPKLGKGATKEERQRWRKKSNSLPILELTNTNVERFQQHELGTVKGDFEKLGAMATTLNFYTRSARSVFGEKILRHYQDFKLPEPLPFRGISKLPEPSHRYRSEINEADLMKAAMSELQGKEPESWVIILLSFGVGLRRKEIDKLLWEQVDFENRRIWIKTTKYFRPKAQNSEYFVDVSEALIQQLASYRDTRQAEDCEDAIFVLPGRVAASSIIRCQPLFRKTYNWLRKHGVNTQKPLHTLRKEAGSILLEKSGNLQKVANFLRNDIAVTSAHYVGRKERIEMELPGLG